MMDGTLRCKVIDVCPFPTALRFLLEICFQEGLRVCNLIDWEWGQWKEG